MLYGVALSLYVSYNVLRMLSISFLTYYTLESGSALQYNSIKNIQQKNIKNYTMIKAVFFDVDGTLLSHKTRQVPESAGQSLNKLKEIGIKIFLSTGRHSLELEELPLMLVEEDRFYINFIDDIVRYAQQNISTSMPVVEEYKNGLVYQATTFLNSEEERVFRERLPKSCKFTRWSDYGVDIISTTGGNFLSVLRESGHNDGAVFGSVETGLRDSV